MRRVSTTLLFLTVLLPIKLLAHALEPGYLEMTLIDSDRFAVLWKIPALEGAPMAIAVRLPETCDHRVPGELRWDGKAYISRWVAQCPNLNQGIVHIEGLERTSTDVLARIEVDTDVFETLRLTPTESKVALVGRRSLTQIASIYFKLGAEHILAGLDHLLFVAALLLLVSGWRRIVGTITAFTAAHSITLAMSSLGFITFPVLVIEALIALSIVFVAAEAVHLRQGKHSLTSEQPWAIAFLFGLLHGVGFASALSEIGLPQSAISAALLFFNLGVEAGQLLFVAMVLVAINFLIPSMRRLKQIKTNQMAILGLLPAYAIGCVSAFWVLQRIQLIFWQLHA